MRRKLRNTPDIAIATAFLNPSGFNLIADELEQAPRVRLLLGAEPEQEVIRAINDSDADRTVRLTEALKRHSAWIVAERDALGFTRESSDQSKRLVRWLKQVDLLKVFCTARLSFLRIHPCQRFSRAQATSHTLGYH
jgi:hypothetical protein